MGAFFFQKDTDKIPQGVLEIFARKGFSEPLPVKVPGSVFIYYPKQFASSNGVFSSDKLTVVVSGTCVYRGSAPDIASRALHDDWLRGQLDLEVIHGNFAAFFIREGEVTLLCDSVGQYAVYYSDSSRVVSSSFIAAVKASAVKAKLKPNRMNITEVLMSGSGFGKETMVKDIHRFCPYDEGKISFLADTVVPKSENSFEGITSLAPQADSLNDHFQKYRNLFKSFGAVSGLTGGFDSRLIYLLIRDKTHRIKLFTNTYNSNSNECKCAQGFAEEAGCDFTCFTPERPEQMDTQSFKRMINQGFYFWDGVCRVHHLWFEKRKSRDFLSTVYRELHCGVSGVGGERFRIHDGLSSPSYPVNAWIDNEVLEYSSGKVLNESIEAGQFLDYFREKIRDLAGIEPDDQKVSLSSIRNFYNKVYNTANRTQRGSIENQLVYFISPFVEPGLSCIGTEYLRKHPMLEVDLIRYLGPELADCMTDYGYSPHKPRMLPSKLTQFAKSKHLFGCYHRIRRFAKTRRRERDPELISKHPFLEEYFDQVRALKLPLDIGKLYRNPALLPLVLQTGMFLSEMEDCVDIP